METTILTFEWWIENIMDDRLDKLNTDEKYAMYLIWIDNYR